MHLFQSALFPRPPSPPQLSRNCAALLPYAVGVDKGRGHTPAQTHQNPENGQYAGREEDGEEAARNEASGGDWRRLPHSPEQNFSERRYEAQELFRLMAARGCTSLVGH
eukprot:766902-Hanusia_phi.AAC.2